jgi:hypothetical protein
MDELATHADAVHVSTGYSVLPSPPIPAARQVQGARVPLNWPVRVRAPLATRSAKSRVAVGREMPVWRRLGGGRRASQALASSKA